MLQDIKTLITNIISSLDQQTLYEDVRNNEKINYLLKIGKKINRNFSIHTVSIYGNRPIEVTFNE